MRDPKSVPPKDTHAGEWTDYIVCPYCGERDEEYTDYPPSLKYDGDSTTYVCFFCDRDFTVSLSVDYSYRADTLEPKP